MLELGQSFAQAWSRWLIAASWQLALLVGLVYLATVFLRRRSARLRYGLWLLVLVKVVLPPDFGAPWSLTRWIRLDPPSWRGALITSPGRPVEPATEPSSPKIILEDIKLFRTENSNLSTNEQTIPAIVPSRHPAIPTAPIPPSASSPRIHPLALLLALWLAVALGFLGLVLYRYFHLVRALQTATVVDEGPLCIRLESLTLRLFPRGTLPPPAPVLCLSAQVTSPFLFGWYRPSIVLPASLPASLAPEELDAVLLHELIHWRRRDVAVGWLQVAAQAAFWFHPLVWLANAQLRHERECATDEAVLSLGQASSRVYGESLLRVLLEARGHSSAALGFLGIFERNTRLQQRLEEIMNQEMAPKRFGRAGWLMILIFAALFLPLGVNRPAAQTPASTEKQSTRVTPKRIRYFTRLVVGENGQMTFQGQPATLDDLPQRLAQVPNRPQTVLEFSLTDDQQPGNLIDPIMHKIKALCDKEGFEYMSLVEASPLGTKGPGPVTGAEHPELRWVRVVLGAQGRLTFEGEPVTTSTLVERLAALPGRDKTVLTFALATPALTENEIRPVQDLIFAQHRALGFTPPASFIGQHPLSSYGVNGNTLYNSNLLHPVEVNVALSPNGSRLTPQYAVIAIAEAAGIPYLWDLSAQQADPERRQFIDAVHFSGLTAEQALLNVLTPVGLRFNLNADGLYLYKAPAAASPTTTTEATPPTPAVTAAATPAPDADLSGPPQIVSTQPAVGAVDVDPNLKEITVTFDQDMNQGGFSWTGGGPDFPQGPAGARPAWRDARTCVLPVALAPAHYYRVGINSKSHRNFRSAQGRPARPSAIYFCTAGASDELKQQVRAPKVVTLTPADKATDVDPALTQIAVTFDMPMGGGMSWCGGGDDYPEIPAGLGAQWSADRRTCTLSVKLKPNWEYHLGINCPSANNFMSQWGVSVEPVEYTFKTRP